ncbi:MAG: sodium/solute symporter [Oscillospiraceae bacterium]|jgi:SSS family solute:Na+ symporter|nr:sodium/solute symporter [Oscillospiraceae bacterium]
MVNVIILAVYIAGMIAIGYYASKKTKSVNDFVLGGRNIGTWLTSFAYGTSYFSAVVFIGYAGQFGWNYGMSATWIGIGNALIGSALAWVVLGRRTRLMTAHLGASTMPEFFEKRFGSKSLKIAAAIIVFVFLIPYTASVYNGLSRLFSMAFPIDYSVCVILMAVLTAAYVILGGYTATAINDFVQGIIMLLGIIAVVFCAVQEGGGLGAILFDLSVIEDSAANISQNSLNSLFGPDPLNLLGVVILTSLGTWGLPQMVHKFYAIKNDEAIKKGAVISTLFAFVVAGGSYFLGSFVRVFCSTNAADTGKAFIESPGGRPDFDSMIPGLLEKSLPEILIGVVVILVLSASMSTLSSLVLTSSSTLTIDLIKPFRKKNLSEDRQMLIMRILVAVFLLISVVIALNKNALITTLMSISWGALAGSFLGPFTYGLFSKKVTKAAVWASFASGIGITVLHMCIFTFGGVSGSFLGFNLASPINAGAFAMIVSLIIVPVVSMFTPKIPKETADNAFAAIESK